MEDSVIGLSESGNELLFQNNPNPYSDLPMYKIEKRLMNKAQMAKRDLEKIVGKAYREYGYKIDSL